MKGDDKTGDRAGQMPRTVARVLLGRRHELGGLLLCLGLRILRSWRFLGNPARVRMPLTQDLEPGPHKSVAGLAWEATHLTSRPSRTRLSCVSISPFFLRVESYGSAQPGCSERHT